MTSLLKPQRPPGPPGNAVDVLLMQQQNQNQILNPRSAKMISTFQQLEAVLKMQMNPAASHFKGGNIMPSPRTNAGQADCAAVAASQNPSPRGVKLGPKGALPLPPPPQMLIDDSVAHPVAIVPKPPVVQQSSSSAAASPSAMPLNATVLSAATPATAAREGMSPTTALNRYATVLTAYERNEILSYPVIYFVGENARKIDCTSAAPNNGYDDDKSDYKVVVDDHVGYRYQVLNELGRGSFGQVSKALDHKTKTFVALKIIKNKKKFHDQAMIEANILKHLRDNDPSDKMHIVRMVDNFIFRNHMVITFELHGMNLYELCKVNKFAPLSMATIKTFTKQLLVALQYSSLHKIVHCDLKPENILLKQNSKSHIKDIDYGTSCFENQRLYTYIQSRFYRAPEVMLGIPYTTAIDMWSLGCIMAELANGYPIFPGETEVDQMACVMEYLGTPPRSLIEKGSRKKLFFDANGVPKIVPNSRGKVRRPGTKELAGFLRSGIVDGDVHFADFVGRCMAWDPAVRMTPSQAMSHPWISAMFDESAPAAKPQHSAATGDRKQFVLPQIPQTARRPAN